MTDSIDLSGHTVFFQMSGRLSDMANLYGAVEVMGERRPGSCA